MLANRFDPVTTGEGWDGFAGNEHARDTIRRLGRGARRTGESLVLLLAGRSGIGKSTAAQLVARDELGADPIEITVTPSGGCDIETVRTMQRELAHTSLFGSGWRVWIIEEIDTAPPTTVRALLTILETLPPRKAILMTTNVKLGDEDLFGRLESIPKETQRAFEGRAYIVQFKHDGLATRKGQLGPGTLRVKRIAAQLGMHGRSDQWYLDLYQRKSKGSIREAINRLATA